MLLLVLLAGVPPRPPDAVAQETVIMVTSASDAEMAAGACPDPALCTLRAAIELANATDPGDRITILFDPVVFPLAMPVTIGLSEALPPVTRAFVSIDGAGAGVRINGGGATQGIVFLAAGALVRGLAVHNLQGACVRIAGPASTAGGDARLGHGLRVGDCSVGVATSGAGNLVAGIQAGVSADLSAAAPVGTGIAVTGSGTVIGDDGAGSGFANSVVNAAIGILVGATDGSGLPFAGVRLMRNAVTDSGVGLDLRQPSNGTVARDNSFSSLGGPGIRVGGDSGGQSVLGNSFLGNLFSGMPGQLPIDLNADGVRNPNDADDLDGGANGTLNHPVFTRAVQSSLSGEAGPACAAQLGPCVVQIYLVSHTPGGASDHATAPVPLGLANTDLQGRFNISSPAVSPGQWVAAIATDQAGNTSEFGPAARVGAGTVACGNVSIRAGWNHAGFFGSQPHQLELAFPAGSDPSKVTAIYQFLDSSDSFLRWQAGTFEGRTLTTLVAPEPYWFYASGALVFGGGFALSVPLPVQLKAGWNDFVYIGAADHVRDALGSIEGKWSNLYRFVNDAGGARWQKYGNVDTPEYVRDFTVMEACTAYQLFMSEDVTLVPLQP